MKLRAACIVAGLLTAVLSLNAQTAQSNSGNSKGPLAAISGSGSTNYLPIWTSSTGLGNSKLYQTGGNVGVGTTSPNATLDVVGHVNSSQGFNIANYTVLAIPGGGTPRNNAVGNLALTSNTSGSDNAAVGWGALKANTIGTENTALGNFALYSTQDGVNNTAIGYAALYSNTTAANSTAIGNAALENLTTGGANTAVGAFAGRYYTGGESNIAIGYFAAQNVSSGAGFNIHIGNAGSSSDNQTIRIGDIQTAFYAAGIYGASSGGSGAIPVLVDSSGQLVTVSSSRRFKEDIHNMGDSSHDLMRLRPVTFRYKQPLADGSQPIQYGLIAEEVAEVYPDLVSYAADGQVQSVKYQLLDPMLLNEVQREHVEIEALQHRMQEMEAELVALSAKH